MQALTDLKAILHSKRANIYYLEKCRVMQKDGRVLYLTEEKNETSGNSLIDLCINRLKLHGTFVLEMSSKSEITGDREKYYGDTKLVFWNK